MLRFGLCDHTASLHHVPYLLFAALQKFSRPFFYHIYHICFSPLYRSFLGHFFITFTIFAFRHFTEVFSAIFLSHLPYLLFAALQKFSRPSIHYIYQMCFSPLYRSFLGHFSITSTIFAFRRFIEVFSSIFLSHLPYLLFAALQEFSRPFFYYIYHICFSPLYRSFLSYFSITSTVFAFRRFTEVFSAIYPLHLPNVLFATLQKFSRPFYYHIYHICISPLHRSFLGHFSITSISISQIKTNF